MATVQVSAQVDQALKTAMQRYCKAHDIAVEQFIREALLERLEDLEDAEGLTQIRSEPTRPFADVVRETGVG